MDRQDQYCISIICFNCFLLNNSFCHNSVLSVLDRAAVQNVYKHFHLHLNYQFLLLTFYVLSCVFVHVFLCISDHLMAA